MDSSGGDSFRLTHVPFSTLALVTEWLTGHTVARLWFTGDRNLHRQMERGGVKRIEVKVRWSLDVRIRVPLLSYLTNLETLIISASNSCDPQNELVTTTFDLSVIPASLKVLRIRIPISIRTFAKSPIGRVEYYDWKELMPNLEVFDFSKASVGLYADMCRFMPQRLKSFAFSQSGLVDQEFFDFLPTLYLEELCLHNGTITPPVSAAESIILPRELLKLTWTFPWSQLGPLPSSLQELVLSLPQSYAQRANYYVMPMDDDTSHKLHLQPLWQRASGMPSIKRLALHANLSGNFSTFGNTPGLRSVNPHGVFTTLPPALTSLTVNYTPSDHTWAKLMDMDCFAHLPATLNELILAGFEAPLQHLAIMPCEGLKRLAIYSKGQPAHGKSLGQLVEPGARFRIGRRQVPEPFVDPEDSRYNNVIDIGRETFEYFFPTKGRTTTATKKGRRGPNAANAPAMNPGMLFLLDQYDDEADLYGQDLIDRQEQKISFADFTPQIVSSLPRTLTSLDLPHVKLQSLETLGPHTWPAQLLHLCVGEVPISYAPLLPRSIHSLDCVFVVSDLKLGHGHETRGESRMDLSESEQSTSSLPPYLHRLRCTIPSVTYLKSSLKLPKRITELDLTLQDLTVPEEGFDEEWTRDLPPELRSLAIFGIGAFFSRKAMLKLPQETLQELEMDIFSLGPESGRQKRTSPLGSWSSLPPHLTHFTIRINSLLDFNVMQGLPTRLECLKIEAPGTSTVFSIEHPEWISELPPRLRFITVPLKVPNQRNSVPNLLRSHAIDLEWFE